MISETPTANTINFSNTFTAQNQAPSPSINYLCYHVFIHKYSYVSQYHKKQRKEWKSWHAIRVIKVFNVLMIPAAGCWALSLLAWYRRWAGGCVRRAGVGGACGSDRWQERARRARPPHAAAPRLHHILVSLHTRTRHTLSITLVNLPALRSRFRDHFTGTRFVREATIDQQPIALHTPLTHKHRDTCNFEIWLLSKLYSMTK